MSIFSFLYVLVCNSVVYLKEKGGYIMYIAVTGSKNNKDVYIYQSFRKKDGKSSSRIYKKLGKYNTLLEQFDGDNEQLMAWAKSEAAKETALYNERTWKVTVEFSQAACIPMNEVRSFHAGYLFLQQLCTELRIDNICRVIKGRHRFKYECLSKVSVINAPNRTKMTLNTIL